MITLKLTLDTRRAKKDGSFPLVFRLSLNGQTRDIPTGFNSTDKCWSTITNNIKPSHPLFEIINKELQEKKIKYLYKIIEFEKQFPYDKNIQKIRDYLISKSEKKQTVNEFWKNEIKNLYDSNKNGNALIYSESLKAVIKKCDLNIPFEKIDYSFLKSLEIDFIKQGTGINSINLYLRTFRAVYNKAINHKVVSMNHYPFRNFKLKKEKTIPRTITLNEMKLFFSLQLKPDSIYYESWLTGKLMFMLIGINFKDLQLLTTESIKGDRLIYKRAKTGRMYSIKIPTEAHSILEHFLHKNHNTILGNINLEDKFQKGFPELLKQKNKVFNAHLKQLGKQIKTKEKITGYVFRYTWSNIAKQMGYSKDLIAEALGHEYGNKVTGIYLEAYDKELIDEMNIKVMDKIINKG
ncbi:MAG: site-specific integrase [Sphingobacteriaceae bacterium]|nr:site-specific integrase [Sphingobacteriaceae bacterium]